MNIREFLSNKTLLFDGAMGTYCAEKLLQNQSTPCEELNITHPDEVFKIHSEYASAGAKAIKTNTFGVNRQSFSTEKCEEIITKGYQLASKLEDKAYVFADIGPINVTDCENSFDEYAFVVDIFLKSGASNFLFETNSRLDALLEVSEYIKSKKPDAFIIISFASAPDGFTSSGHSVFKLLKDAADSAFTDAVGLNCVSGAKHMVDLVSKLPHIEKPLSIMPNVGYPTVLGNRTFYNGNGEYFAEQIQKLASLNVKILGGCCGTTPHFMMLAANCIRVKIDFVPENHNEKPVQKSVKNTFWESLISSYKKPFAVELDPPDNADIGRFLKGAAELKNAGADIITIADCPIARARMDSSILACKITRELDMPALPHMTCRDRNLNATKALLLGLCAEGVHNVLIVTGDPIPTAARDEVKSVYNFNSRMLAGYISTLGETALSTPFHIFGALNVNAKNFNVQLNLAKEKLENGMCGFLTQPVLTQRGLDNLKLAKETLDCKILGGIIPIVSHKNALYMNSEVNGIEVDEKIISLYEGKTREEGEDLAVKISAKIAEEIAPYIDGYYLITPFNRTHLICRIINEIKFLPKS